ncbi:hypothetical protein M885DRAFT_504603 [Pelagophyceae sp. CCMP2097]|nr:hypothetical protein M885DRAFT_504603 [Pelagophyceae sp. CCMP2097]|mmetsp:Transcript_12462/g.44222  ORF Transcript_12462/g.44222 Transcript_12462/m.44222 type:complete len:312 (-) Transcript_12462:49-984(-)
MAALELSAAFCDVVPVPQDDGPNAVVPILYADEYRELMGYFRACLVSGEHSPRVLALTAAIVEHNAAHYTVWHVRRCCLFALRSDGDDSALHDELDYVAGVAAGNPKNYQIWYHRRVVVEHLGAGAAEAELDFIAAMLEGDSKNYHGWSHRLWVLKQFGCWGRELAYVDELLAEDAFNNSAWSHRHAVVSATEPKTDAVAAREATYALGFAAAAPENESPWSYALAFASKSTEADKLLLEHCEAEVQADRLSRFVAAALVEVYLRRADAQALGYAASLAAKLSGELDAPRSRFWANRAARIEDSLRAAQEA